MPSTNVKISKRRSALNWSWSLAGGCAVLALTLTGCAGYQLGPTNQRTAGAQSVQVNPFLNKTPEPRLAESITDSIRQEIQKDGTFRLDTGNHGDVIVSGTIVEFNRQGVSFQRRDTRTARDYRITITAQVTARDRISGRVLFERAVRGHSTIRVADDLPSAERQAVPLVAEDLARNVTSLLADGEW